MRTSSNTTVGFVGVGNMGQPMVVNLVKAGWRVMLHDADKDRAAALASLCGCQCAPSLAELAASSSVVILMLPDGKIVRKVVLGEGGDSLVPGLSHGGGVIIDMSSSAPTGTRELGVELAAKGIDMLDAPVSGGVKGAVAGTLAIMVGGSQEVARDMDPILAAMGKRFHVGPLGSGHAVKVLNNYVSAAGLAAAAEALLVARRFGVEEETLIDVFNASTGRNNSTENKFKQYVLNSAYNSGFSLDLMVKDLKLAMDVADACGVEARLGHSCLDLWQAAQSWTGQHADHTEFARFVLNDGTGFRAEGQAG